VADRLILLLDGVNEMPTEALRRELAQFQEENSTVPMIFTTRDLEWGFTQDLKVIVPLHRF
jgi:hypothetical protein